MARPRKEVDLKRFHTAAKKAANDGMTMKEFAKTQGTLANNVKATLYEAFTEFGLAPITFPEPTPKKRGRKAQPTNLSMVSLYTGRAKVPYLTMKVPRSIVAKSGANDGDTFEWRINRRGDIVASLMGQE